MVKFTIITCTYNAAGVIDRTLLSVQQQSYHNIEHLIIDGASKDDTVDIAKRYKNLNARFFEVVITSEPDKGLYDAMNKGIKKATGDYLIFLNAGDTFNSIDTLNLVAEQAGDTKPDLPWKPKEEACFGVIYGNTDIVDNEGKFLHKRRLSPPEHLTWKSFKDGMLVCHQSFYASTEVAKRNLYDLQYKYSADVDWCIRIMKDADEHGMTLHNTHLTLTSYLAGGMSIKNHRASLIERFQIMRKHYGLITTVLKHISFIVRL